MQPYKKGAPGKAKTEAVRSCRICGSTDPCHWAEDDLCSICEPMAQKKQAKGKTAKQPARRRKSA